MTEIYLKILAALAPAIILAVVMIRKDMRPEPIGWLMAAVGLGVLVGPAVLLLGYLCLPDIQADTFMGAFLSSFVSAAIPEEGLKFAALLFLARRCRHFDEMFDGIVYAVCIIHKTKRSRKIKRSDSEPKTKRSLNRFLLSLVSSHFRGSYFACVASSRLPLIICLNAL